MQVNLIAQRAEALREGMGTIEITVRPILVEEQTIIGNQEVLLRFSFGPKMSKRVQNQPIKYAGMARIWLSKSTYDRSQATLAFSANSKDLFVRPNSSGTLQELMISGIPDFQYLTTNINLVNGRAYQVDIEIKEEATMVTESSSATSDSFLFEESTQKDLLKQNIDSNSTNELWYKKLYRNKYVKWGVGAALLSVGGYIGYTQLSKSSSSAQLPTPPPPPVIVVPKYGGF